MSDMEAFTMIEEKTAPGIYDTFIDLTSAKTSDHDLQYIDHLRKSYPELIITAVPSANCNLLRFAAVGLADAVRDDTVEEPATGWRGWIPALGRREKDTLGQTIFFARYRYRWSNEDFLLYTVGGVQYILKEPRGSETTLSTSAVVDALITAVGTWQTADPEIVWVFDQYWTRDKALFEQIKKAEWDNVILDPDQKQALQDVSTNFFESEDIYRDLGVPWKRGIIFHGPPGNGKTISIKALMHTLLRHDPPIPTLYVKRAATTYQIRSVFEFARRLVPCLLVLEDIETIVTPQTRSYFFNEVDGLESNDGLLMVASTNFLERLDPGLSKRPSRFDRKYLFPLPNEYERTLYAEYWRRKLERNKNKIDFPQRLCPAMAAITDQFSFAYLQEAFVTTLLVIARKGEHSPSRSGAYAYRDLDKYEMWRVFRQQVEILRGEMGSDEDAPVELHHDDSRRAEMSEQQIHTLDCGSDLPEEMGLGAFSALPRDMQSLSLGRMPVRNDERALLDLPAVGTAGGKRLRINSSAFDYGS